MAVDPARATLVTQPFRYAEAPDAATGAAIRAANETAPLIEIDTNLDQAGATALAADIASLTGLHVRTYSVPFEDVLTLDDLKTGAPRYFLDFPRHVSVGAGAYQVVGGSIDFFNDLSTVKVRGS